MQEGGGGSGVVLEVVSFATCDVPERRCPSEISSPDMAAEGGGQ